MTFYCPGCWREVPKSIRVCSHCKVDVERLSAGQDYVQKLISALDHPEPTTPVRAAWILGILKEPRAVQRLARLARESDDPYIIEAAVEALGGIGDPAALDAIRIASQRGGVRVREKARQAISLIQGTTFPRQEASTEIGEGDSSCGNR